jgi:hypothetical protein
MSEENFITIMRRESLGSMGSNESGDSAIDSEHSQDVRTRPVSNLDPNIERLVVVESAGIVEAATTRLQRGIADRQPASPLLSCTEKAFYVMDCCAHSHKANFHLVFRVPHSFAASVFK